MSLNWESIQKASKELETNMKNAHQELNALEFTGEAGAGLVTATVLGNYRVKSIDISENALDEFDDNQKKSTFIGDLCAAAYNDAANKIETYSKDKMKNMAMKFDLNKDETT